MNRRDIELLISARDTTGRTFREVSSNIDALNKKITEQVAAAERGDISLQDLRRSQEALAQAGRDLSGLQGQIDGYRRLTEQQVKATDAADKAVKAQEAFLAKIAAQAAPTAAQERKLAGLEAKVQSTGLALVSVNQNLAESSAALERAGIDVKNLDAAQLALIASARATGQGLVALRSSVDDYAQNVRNAAQAERDLASQKAFASKLAEAQRLGDASRFVQLYAQAVERVELSDQKLAALQGFRSVGMMAKEAALYVNQFGDAAVGIPPSTDDIAQGLRAILQPGQEAIRTLDGVEAAIASAAGVAMAEKQSVAQYSNALNQLSEASAALLRQGALVDSFKNQEEAAGRAKREFIAAQAEVRRLGGEMQRADQPTEELARDLLAAEQRLKAAGRELVAEESKLKDLSRALDKAGIDTNDLAAAQTRLAAAAQQASAATTSANQVLGRGGERAKGFLGLNPYELQNLGFQVNDIFTSLASGQRPLTVLAQQGGQIAQIFPGLITAGASFVASWLPVIGVVVGVGLAFNAVADQMTRLQQATLLLAQLGLADTFDPTKVVEAQQKFEDLGLSAEDAGAAIKTLLEATSDPAQFDSMIQSAALLQEKLGIELPEATELLVGVMQGGIEATEALATSTNLLTGEELDHAQALFDAGNAAEARQFILDRVTQKLEQQASLTDGVFTPAVDNLKTAFGNLASFLRGVFGPILDFINEKIQNAIVGFTFLTALLAGKTFEQARLEAGGVAGLGPQAARNRGGGPAGASDQQIRDRAYLRGLDEESGALRGLTREERLRRVEINARREAQAAGVSDAVAETAAVRARREEERKINQEESRAGRRGAAANRRADAARRCADREAATLENRRDTIRNQLENQLRQLDSATGRGRSATLEQRLAVVDNQYEKIFDTLSRARDLGLTAGADGQTFDQITDQVNAAKELLKQQERIKFFEDQISLLTAQRTDEVANITDAQERGAKTVADAFRDAEGVNGRISPQIVEAARNALAIARTIAGTNPSPEMVSMIARLERIIAGEGVNNIAATVATGGLDNQESKLNSLLSDRNALVESYNTLRELGLRTDEEARQLSVAAYAQTAPAIAAQTAQIRQTVELLHQQRDALTGLPVLSDTAYATWITRLDAVNAGLTRVDDRITQVNNAAMTGIQNGVNGAFQTVADTLVGLVSGTLSWGDALNNVLNGALSLAQSFLSAIAEVLVQMVALQVAKSLIGGSTGGFGGLFFHDGGVVGVGGSRRTRTGGMGSWAGAPKFHGGGGVGLKPDEYKAVLKRGEEVLTESNPRHINNIGAPGTGAGGGGGPSIRQNLLFDPNEIPRAMQSKQGERTILTIIKANKPTIKAMLG